MGLTREEIQKVSIIVEQVRVMQAELRALESAHFLQGLASVHLVEAERALVAVLADGCRAKAAGQS